MTLEPTRTRPSARHFQHVVNGLFQQAMAASDGGSTGFQSLPVNVSETDDAYHATLLAPGLDEQTIKVTVHDTTLSIEGALAFAAPEGARSVWQEFGPTHFRRNLRLGTSVDPARVEAVYRNGLLVITMPKAEHSKPRQIQVQGTSSEVKS